MNRAEKFLERANVQQTSSLQWVSVKPSSETHEVVLSRLFKDGSQLYAVRPVGTK